MYHNNTIISVNYDRFTRTITIMGALGRRTYSSATCTVREACRRYRAEYKELQSMLRFSFAA